LLSDTLGRAFVDLDQIIEASHGSISKIFSERGEPAFREMESLALEHVLKSESGCVLATGGGIVERESNRSRLPDHGFVVWLDADAAQLVDRLSRAPFERPPLTENRLELEVEQMLQRRRPGYMALADFRVDTGKNQPRDSVRLILDAYRAWLNLRGLSGT
jgi:shikimate kinase